VKNVIDISITGKYLSTLVCILSFNAFAVDIAFTSFIPRDIQYPQTKAVELKYSLNESAAVKLSIFDFDGETVYSASYNGVAGENALSLDLESFENRLFDGAYTFTLVAAANDKTSSYSPAKASAFDALPIVKWSFMPETNELEFVLPTTGMVRARLYRKPNFYVATLQDWKPMVAGAIKLKWNGKDASGNDIRLTQENYEVRMSSYSLPQNTFVVHSGKVKPPREDQKQIEWRNQPELIEKFLHARIPRERARDIPMACTVLRADSEEVVAPPYNISGPIRVRVECEPDVIRRATDERFEVCAYLDGQLIFEEEDGVLPYTFHFDPTGLGAGKNLLSFVIITSFDHVGSTSISLTGAKKIQPVNEGNKE